MQISKSEYAAGSSKFSVDIKLVEGEKNIVFKSKL